MKTPEGKMFCDVCHQQIPIRSIHVLADGRDIHTGACFRRYNIDKWTEERQIVANVQLMKILRIPRKENGI